MAGIITMPLCALIIASAAFSVQADNFLGAGGAQARSQEVQQQFFNQLKASLGHGDVASIARLERMQSQIKSLYSAMPKNADEGLDPGAARYALHRFLVLKHGWHVRGLETTGAEKWSDAASVAALEDRIPSYVLDLFEQHRGGRTGLRELAVLAATLEDVVHSEAVQLLSTAFVARGLSVEEKVSASDEEAIIQTYLLFHLMPNPMYAEMDRIGLNNLIRRAPERYSGWTNTVMWARDLRNSIYHDESPQRSPFVGYVAPSEKTRDFNSIVRLVEKMGETYGQYQNIECRGLKNVLLDLSDGSGRVHLAKFYKATYEGHKSDFKESPEYLRHLGVLDETDALQPTVLVTNYIYSRANCMASSGLYSICCIDECEALMAHLEKNIANPLADPNMVAELVAAMPSDTVAAPRNLSAVMRRRLDDIAQRHGGSVPLHGRLFAQWMHHAFPNECRYPHMAGSLQSPLTPREWRHAKRGAGHDFKASTEQMQAIIELASPSNVADPLDSVQEFVPLPWTEEEELAVGILPAHPLKKARSGLRVAAQSVAVFTAMVGFVRMLSAAHASECPAKAGKHSSWPLVSANAQKLDKQWV